MSACLSGAPWPKKKGQLGLCNSKLTKCSAPELKPQGRRPKAEADVPKAIHVVKHRPQHKRGDKVGKERPAGLETVGAWNFRINAVRVTPQRIFWSQKSLINRLELVAFCFLN